MRIRHSRGIDPTRIRNASFSIGGIDDSGRFSLRDLKFTAIVDKLIEFDTSGAQPFLQRGCIAAIQQGEPFVAEIVARYRVGLAPGSAFGPGGEGHLRLCFAASQERLSQALDQLGPLLG